MSDHRIHEHSPNLDLGGFSFGSVAHEKIQQDSPSADPNPPLGVLSYLQGKTFKGKGFTTTFRPRSEKPLNGIPVPGIELDNDLQLSLTEESLVFSAPIGTVPNRGLESQPDITLGGIMYVHSAQDVTNQETGKSDGTPTDIHIEPGMWMSVPPAPESAIDAPTLCRMGSIPHGVTINAQGDQPDLSGIPGPPPIFAIDITPFEVDSPRNTVRFPGQDVQGKLNRIPQDLGLFDANGVITQEMLNDPNTVLRKGLEKQNILRTITWKVNTSPSLTIEGGGTANIAFLGGPGATVAKEGGKANALAHSLEATFWLETVEYMFTARPGIDIPQAHQPCGKFGPTLIVPPTTDRSSATTITTTYAQLQYSQVVHLRFNGLNWPHVSVATLVETSTMNVLLPPAENS